MKRPSYPQYLLEEPTTGLYIVLGHDRARLTSRRAASTFTTRGAAYLAAQYIADQPHELVRVDA